METKDKKRWATLCVALLHRVLEGARFWINTSAILSGLFGRKIGVSGSQIITTTLVIITTLLAILAYLEVGLNNIPVSLKLIRWVDSESLNISWAFHFDALTVSMLLPVLVVSSLVHLYSISYMSHDPQNNGGVKYLIPGIL